MFKCPQRLNLWTKSPSLCFMYTLQLNWFGPAGLCSVHIFVVLLLSPLNLLAHWGAPSRAGCILPNKTRSQFVCVNGLMLWLKCVIKNWGDAWLRLCRLAGSFRVIHLVHSEFFNDCIVTPLKSLQSHTPKGMMGALKNMMLPPVVIELSKNA